MRLNRALLLLAGLAWMGGTSPGWADGEGLEELTVGGLSFSPAAAVSVEPRSVVVGLDAVSFQYGLSNPAPQPVAVEISLKMPTPDLSDPDVSYAIPTDDPVNFLGAVMTLDGVAAPLVFKQTAELDGHDVTRQLKDAKLPLLPGAALKERLSAVAPEALVRIVADGLIKPNGTAGDGTQNFVPAWTVKTVGTHERQLEPGRTAVVEARLKASLGASQDTVLRKAVRQQDGMGEQVAALRKRFCVDDALVGGIDKLAGVSADNVGRLGERRLAVRLPTVPAGGHSALQITLDKGAADNLVSTCLTGLKKTGPTSFAREGASGPPLPSVVRLLVVGRF